MISDQKNMFLAIGLSLLVILGWQYFIGGPQLERQREEAKLRQQQQQQQQAQQSAPGTIPQPGATTQPGVTPQPGAAAPAIPGQPTIPGQTYTREAVLAASPRVAIETPTIQGSVSLRGGRLDDVSLIKYRETVGQPASVLRPVRLDQRRRQQGQGSRRHHGLDSSWLGRARRRQADHPDLGQWRGPRIPA